MGLLVHAGVLPHVVRAGIDPNSVVYDAVHDEVYLSLCDGIELSAYCC